MNIAVYLGASSGNNPSFEEAVCQLGTWIAEHGHTLVYGGSKWINGQACSKCIYV